MPLPFKFDFKKPDYIQVFEWRLERLNRIRQNPNCLPKMYAFYRENPVQFIIDWGSTQDARNPERGLPSTVPFLLFPRQEELANFIVEDCWKGRSRGQVVKCRDVGMSWVTTALGVALCSFNDELAIGYASYKEEYVDKIGDPKAFFVRLRLFREMLPREFRFGYNPGEDSPFRLMKFTHNNSVIKGEVGSNIGRGDRTSIYFVDEYASFAQPMLTESSLSNTTNCRIDMSTVRGMNNPFAQKYHAKNNIKKFVFGWQSDPRKDASWYKKMQDNLDPITMAQEVDMDFNAAVSGRLIDQAWLESCVDAHIKLNIEVTGQRHGAMDIADEGKDKNAFGCGQGIFLEFLEEWSGKGSDIFESVEKVFEFCDEQGCDNFNFDADGLGAGARGDARVLNERRDQFSQIKTTPWKGSSTKLWKPEEYVNKDRGVKNQDFFLNLKAQGWWQLRNSFLETHRALTMPNYKYNPEKIISLSSSLKHLDALKIELGQIAYIKSKTGKVQIDKAPDGCKSPNLADVVMIWNAPKVGEINFFSG